MTLYDEISRNNRATIFLFIIYSIFYGIVLFFFFILIGLPPSIPVFSISTLIILGFFFFIIYPRSSNIVLSVTKARPLKKEEFPYVFNSVEALSIGAGIPVPKVYVIDNDALNAFATGTKPEKSVIVLTTGIIKKMNRLELEGVIAHEMSHIKNYDIRTMLVAAVFAMAIALLADIGIRSLWFGGGRRRGEGGGILLLIGLVFMIIAPIVSLMIMMAISRNREYAADASGAMLTRYPEGLAGALEKIKAEHQRAEIQKRPIEMQGVNEATRHLFFFDPKGVKALFSTHPNIDKRIKKLREM